MSNKKRILSLAGVVLILLSIVLLIFFFGKEKDKKTVVGMVLTGSIDEPGWNGHHYIGLKTACEELNADLIVKQNIAEYSGECENAVKELLESGAELIILGSFNYQDEISDLIEQNPDTSFYCCSSGDSTKNASVFFVRAYQARYLAGVVAGLQTENNKIGYVAAMSNSEVNRGINAFTLGVRSVNPEASVYVVWTGDWSNENKERNAVRRLIDEVGVDLITYHQNQDFVIDEADKSGIYSIGYHEYIDGYSERYLTASIESWENVYKEIIREYMQGQANSGGVIWVGLEKDAVGLAPFTDLVSAETRQAVEDASSRMENGWEVFSGLIVANDGTIKCQDGEAIRDEIIFEETDWLVEGVICYED